MSEAERPPRLNLYDDSSIGGTYTPLPTPAPVTVSMTEAGNKLATSTPKPPQTKVQGGTGIKMKAATFDGQVLGRTTEQILMLLLNSVAGAL